jgi:hypothetical protein
VIVEGLSKRIRMRAVAEFWWSWTIRRYSSRLKVDFCELVMVVCPSNLTVFLVLECVDVDGFIGGLGCNEFVDRIPSDTLNEIAVLGDIADLIA